MVIHEQKYDDRGSGSWDANTTRYIPMNGGSRFRIPMMDSSEIRRYYGFVGVDERMSEEMDSLKKLYAYLGGRPAIPTGNAGPYVQKLMELSLRWMKPDPDAAPPAEATAEEE